MKKLLITMLFLCLPVQAWALIPEIGTCVYSDGDQWYENYGNGCGTSFMQGSNIAYEFNLYDTFNIGSIESLMVWNDRIIGRTDTLGGNIVIYEGSIDSEHYGRTPTSNRIFEQRFSFTETLDFAEWERHIDTQFPMEWRGVSGLNLKLEPGNYWAAVEDGTQYMFVSGAPMFGLADNLGAIHTPEPLTLLMVGGGLIGMAWKRRRP